MPFSQVPRGGLSQYEYARKMNEIWRHCKEIGLEPPEEVSKYVKELDEARVDKSSRVYSDLIPPSDDSCWEPIKNVLANPDPLTEAELPISFAVHVSSDLFEIRELDIYYGVTRNIRPEFYVSAFVEVDHGGSALLKHLEPAVFEDQVNWDLSAIPAWEDVYEMLQDFASRVFSRIINEMRLVKQDLKTMIRCLDVKLNSVTKNVYSRSWGEIDPFIAKQQRVDSARRRKVLVGDVSDNQAGEID